jgi:undecaprenyl-diphosphatase
LVATRTPTWNLWTHIGSYLGETVTVIAIAVVATVILAVRRFWASIAFLVGALLIEVTSFLVTTFLIDRDRPHVPKLDVAPPTSSYPSGHTAAAIVLYTALAIIISSRTRLVAVRVLVWTLAVVLPIAVGLSRMQRGMHHPTDLAGSVIGAVGCLLWSAFAVRCATASAEADAGEDAAPHLRTTTGTTDPSAQEVRPR